VDSATALTIYETFKSLNQTYGLTTLIVSHDPTIARHVDRVVAIRDGRLSSETMRQAPTMEDLYGKPAAEGEHPAPVFEELVVLDSAGRLQVPKEYLQRFNIKGRARLEATENGVLILPVEQQDAEAAENAAQGAASPGAASRGLLGRIRGKH